MYNSGNYLDINEIERLLSDSFLPLKKIDRRSVYKAGKDGLLAIVNSRIFSEPTGDYLWNWTVGDVNINSFMWYGGYGYSTYSYIDFTQKYIYLNGYINSSVEQQSVNVYGVW